MKGTVIMGIIALIGLIGMVVAAAFLIFSEKLSKVKVFVLVTLMIFGLGTSVTAATHFRNETNQAKVTVLKDAGVPELTKYFESNVGMSDIVYNKETKKLIITTNEYPSAENIANMDKNLSKNSKIKSVEFASASQRKQASHIVVIIHLK